MFACAESSNITLQIDLSRSEELNVFHLLNLTKNIDYSMTLMLFTA